MKLIDSARLARLQALAKASPRRRTNDNFHTDGSDPVQRFLNALEPGTYVRPHRHTAPPRWEMLVVLTGRAAVLLFDAAGRVTERFALEPGGDACGVEVAPGCFHSVVALASGTVLLEIKPGPYLPAADKEFAPWAPAEGSGEAAPFQARLQSLRPGDDAPPPSMAK